RVADEWLPILAGEGLVDAVDAFCEGIGFSAAEVTRVFERAQGLGLPVKLHAEQLSNLDGAALVARHRGLSADHLEHLDEAGAAAMAAAGTVAVLLPGAYYALRETRLPPVAMLRSHGVPLAVATDLNPGTSPLRSLLAAANLACTLFRLTPEEALRGITRNAARALGLDASKGSLEVGKDADIAVYDVREPAELCYWIGGHEASLVLAAGRPLG
ncbi:MAG TPA: amidohydrolase family protein, partial [Candidatus Saccharimonadia bacterium]|nr:amidohydrolase family protein [Candidatus Saccharimonadia bacterium]